MWYTVPPLSLGCLSVSLSGQVALDRKVHTHTCTVRARKVLRRQQRLAASEKREQASLLAVHLDDKKFSSRMLDPQRSPCLASKWSKDHLPLQMEVQTAVGSFTAASLQLRAESGPGPLASTDPWALQQLTRS